MVRAGSCDGKASYVILLSCSLLVSISSIMQVLLMMECCMCTGDPGPWSFACRIADTETRYAVVMEAHR